MTYRSPQRALRALYQTATTQGGYFTAKQAREAGYGYTHALYHVQAGNFDHIDHGLYRLPTVPVSEHDDLIRLSLWSRGREDNPLAVISHESALFIHQLSDVMPRRVHLSVPPNFRKPMPRGCVFHKASLSAQDIEEREGYRVTTPLRTLLDVASEGKSTREQLFQAVADALDRGLVRKKKLVEAAEEHPQTRSLLLAPSLTR